jgi:fructokinase
MEDLADGRSVSTVGIASFGPIDLRTDSPHFGTIISTPKPEWSGVDVVRALGGGGNVPFGVDTDVAGALVGEHRWGAASGSATSAYVTVGTGIGAALMVDGVVVRGANHSEVGHARVPAHRDDPFPGRCPYHGDCLEGMASGRAIEDRFGARTEDLGDDDRATVTDLVAWYVAHGIVSMISVVPVELVVIGGGLAKLDGFHDAVSRVMARASGSYPPVPFAEGGPAVVPPMLGDDAGVVGAIELGRSAAERG